MKKKWMVIFLLPFVMLLWETGGVQAAVETYFEVTKDTKVYDNSTGKLVEQAEIKAGYVFRSNGGSESNWLTLQFGNKNLFIHKNTVKSVPKVHDPFFFPSPSNSNVYVKLPEQTFVYAKQNQVNVIGVLQPAEFYPLYKERANDYEIIFGGKVAYIPKTTATLVFKSDSLYYKVIKDRLPLYDNSSGRLVQTGTLEKGAIFKRLQESGGNWHQIEIGNEKRFIAVVGTEPAFPSSFKGKPLSSMNQSVNKVEKDLVIYDNSSGSLVPIGTIHKGETFLSPSRPASTWYSINWSGKEGFVHGQSITSSTIARDLVNPYQTYSYKLMEQDLGNLEKMYPGLIRISTIGKSVDGRSIYAVNLGKGKKEILVNASLHAREHITTNLAMEMVDQYALQYMKGQWIQGYSLKKILDEVSFVFVPMVNPDGVTLVQYGAKTAKNPSYVLKLNGGKSNFGAWKANIRGVDLNRQFDSDWKNAKTTPTVPAPSNYKGPYAFSEPEAVAMKNLVLSHNFSSAVNYHSSGQVLYWYYYQSGSQYTRDLKLAKEISNMTGYSIITPKGKLNGVGFMDYFIKHMKKPSFTPEVSPYVGNQPVPVTSFMKIWSQNKAVPLMLADQVIKGVY